MKFARLIALASLACSLSAASDAEFFESRIRPVLAGKCYGCHSERVKAPAGGIRLDSAAAIAPLTQGGVKESRLYRSLTYQHAVKMPPSGKLEADVLTDFSRWLDAGAVFPAAVAKSSGSWWAFEPLKPGALELKAPTSAKPLEKSALLRRVTYDLTGLPPTPAELSAFLNDSRPDAYARVVDRLLASPHYGERWARHFMDLVRYAETNGHEYDNDKLVPWRYRDYLIRAFNADVPYNQIVKEHIAGDLLPKPRISIDGTYLESPLATAHYFFGEVLNSTTDPIKSRADEVDNQIDVMGKAFTGLTVACARCHDHKFDPIPTADYYGMAGVLHSTAYREVVVDSPTLATTIQSVRSGGVLVPVSSTVTYRNGDNPVASFNKGTFENWRSEGAAFGNAPIDGSATSLAAGAPEFVGSLTSPLIDMPDQMFLHVRLSGTKTEGNISERTPVRLTLVCGGYKARHVVPKGANPEWITLTLVLERKRRCYVELIDHSRDGYLTLDELAFSDTKEPPPTTGGTMRQGPLNSVAVPPSTFAVSAGDAEGHDVRVHVRGNHQTLGDNAPRRFLTALAGANQPPITHGSGRLEIAERMVAHPIAARVFVNRVWGHRFGEGLVKSTDNFGVMGEKPKDQALLDALAARFVASEYSTKSLDRLLVLSELYQSDALKPRRLEAESVRDAILAVSGTLDRTLFGPSIVPHISPFQSGRGRPASGPLDSERRRSIYIQIRRNFIPPLFIAFDYPPPASTTGTRGSSAVPSQALILLNNELVHNQARLLATSILAGAPDTRLDELYLRAFSRKPEEAERQRLKAYIEANSARAELDVYTDVAHVILNSPEFLYVR